MPRKEADKIDDRLLYGRDNLVIAMPDRTGDQARCYVFQVLPGGHSPLVYRPLDLRNSSGTIQTLNAAGGSADYQSLYDSNGNDILRIRDRDRNNYYIYHFSIAVQQDRIRVYPRIPPTQTGGGFEWLSANQPDPTAGDPYGYQLGSQMDFYNPPRELETVSFRSGTTSNVEYGFYNEHPDRRITPRLHIKGRAYLMKPYTEESDRKKIISGQEPRTMIGWGPIKDSFEPGTPDEWDDKAMTMIDKATLRKN